MESLVKPDQIWVLWAFLIGWAAKVTSSVIALLGSLILSNLHIVLRNGLTG